MIAKPTKNDFYKIYMKMQMQINEIECLSFFLSFLRIFWTKNHFHFSSFDISLLNSDSMSVFFSLAFSQEFFLNPFGMELCGTAHFNFTLNSIRFVLTILIMFCVLKFFRELYGSCKSFRMNLPVCCTFFYTKEFYLSRMTCETGQWLRQTHSELFRLVQKESSARRNRIW